MARLVGSAALAVALSFAGELVWSLLFRLNLRFIPDVAWAAVVMCSLMAVSWRSLPATMRLRAMMPRTSAWPWLSVAVVSVTACLTGMVILGFRVGHFTSDAFRSSIETNNLSMTMRAAGVIMTALVAAFFEEIGFRGLLQPRLERRFGRRLAILGTALLFYAVHLFHGWTRGDAITALAVAVPMVVGGIFFGALASYTNSVAPSILAHAGTDLALLPLEWSGRYNVTPVTTTGVDVHFSVWTAVTLVSFAATLYVFNRLSSNVARKGS